VFHGRTVVDEPGSGWIISQPATLPSWSFDSLSSPSRRHTIPDLGFSLGEGCRFAARAPPLQQCPKRTVHSSILARSRVKASKGDPEKRRARSQVPRCDKTCRSYRRDRTSRKVRSEENQDRWRRNLSQGTLVPVDGIPRTGSRWRSQELRLGECQGEDGSDGDCTG